MKKLRLNSTQVLTKMEMLQLFHQAHVSTSFQVCINAECVDMEKTYKSANCSSKCKGHAVSVGSQHLQFAVSYAVLVMFC